MRRWITGPWGRQAELEDMEGEEGEKRKVDGERGWE